MYEMLWSNRFRSSPFEISTASPCISLLAMTTESLIVLFFKPCSSDAPTLHDSITSHISKCSKDARCAQLVGGRVQIKWLGCSTWREPKYFGNDDNDYHWIVTLKSSSNSKANDHVSELFVIFLNSQCFRFQWYFKYCDEASPCWFFLTVNALQSQNCQSNIGLLNRNRHFGRLRAKITKKLIKLDISALTVVR